VLNDELKQYVEEEYFKVSWNFRRRVRVDLNEDTDVLFERNEFLGEMIVIC
jgi:hypothetical protein